jgi:methylthioribulose-1-phosphate dehydratase
VYVIEQRLSESVEVALLALVRHCHARGWSLATSGNFSARISENCFAITKSGFDKGSLGAEHLLRVDIDGKPLEPGIPSAETLLHAQIYSRRPKVHCVVHTHSVPATIVSRTFAHEGHLVLNGFEIAKALSGIDTHESTVRLPIFPNDQDIPRLAQLIDAQIGGDDHVHGYLLEGHGLYTWGKDVSEARKHLDAIEFLLDCGLHWRMPPMMGRG